MKVRAISRSAMLPVRRSQLNTGGGTLLLAPGTSPAAVRPTHTGTDATASTVSFASDLAVTLDGPQVDTEYTQLNVSGTAVTEQGVNAAKKFLPFWATVTR